MKKFTTRKAIALLKSGFTPKEIRAKLPSVASSTITDEARILGLRFNPGQPRGPSPALAADRRLARKLRAQGLQLREIGERMNRTKQGAAYLLK